METKSDITNDQLESNFDVLELLQSFFRTSNEEVSTFPHLTNVSHSRAFLQSTDLYIPSVVHNDINTSV